jgi:hypothetical protein
VAAQGEPRHRSPVFEFQKRSGEAANLTVRGDIHRYGRPVAFPGAWAGDACLETRLPKRIAFLHYRNTVSVLKFSKIDGKSARRRGALDHCAARTT